MVSPIITGGFGKDTLIPTGGYGGEIVFVPPPEKILPKVPGALKKKRHFPTFIKYDIDIKAPILVKSLDVYPVAVSIQKEIKDYYDFVISIQKEIHENYSINPSILKTIIKEHPIDYYYKLSKREISQVEKASPKKIARMLRLLKAL